MRFASTARRGVLPSRPVCAALLAASLTACAPAPAPPVEDVRAADVEAAYGNFEEAWEQEDVEDAVGAFAPDAVVIDPVPPGRFDTADSIRGWITGAFAALDRISITSSRIHFQTEGPVAWGTVHYVFEAQKDGKPDRVEGDLTMVWVRQQDGSLKMSVFHASHLPEGTR